ncbi:hypothetical protein LSAT2_005181 [Lamellibrachia satsuma]|nr:hypothetical protein LSAT2_005181 [Lamellibrachia satsuma]
MTGASRPDPRTYAANMADVLVPRVLFEVIRLLIVFEVWSHLSQLLLPRTPDVASPGEKQSSTATKYRSLVDRHTLDVLVHGLSAFTLRHIGHLAMLMWHLCPTCRETGSVKLSIAHALDTSVYICSLYIYVPIPGAAFVAGTVAFAVVTWISTVLNQRTI